MERQVQESTKLGNLTDNDDMKYVSRLSTILVASLQEAKDKISQVEYVFCGQLFPHFQSKSKIMQKIYSEARIAAQVEWKEKENDLLLQIEKLELEKQKTLKENQSLKLDKEKLLKEKEEEIGRLLSQLKCQQDYVNELKTKLLQKSKESTETLELQNKLLDAFQSKVSEIANNKEKELKEHKEETIMLLAKVGSLERKVEELQEELREKTVEIAKGNEIKEDLLKKIDAQACEIMNNEQLFYYHVKEKKILVARLEQLEENSCKLQKDLLTKSKEVEEGKILQKELSDCINQNDSAMLKYREQLEMGENEKNSLLVKVGGLEEKVNDLQVELRERTNETFEGKVLHGKLVKRNESKSAELQAQEKKFSDLVDAYKRLKSEHKYMRRKLGLTSENVLSNKLEDETGSLGHNQNQINSPDLEDNNQDTSIGASEHDKVQNENNLAEEKAGKIVQSSSSRSPNNTFPVASKCPSTVKSAPVAGKKRAASSWRDTRSHKGVVGPDPHDDFLDTPFEHVRGNLNKAMKEEVCDIPITVLKDAEFNSSGDETQDVNADLRTQKREMPAQTSEKKGFKYVEPVRKKAERENLKGVECKQCKKFYDAVLCNDEDKNNHNIRCEHRDGVSRHRYRYVPPMTPEGFWNIGFESEN